MKYSLNTREAYTEFNHSLDEQIDALRSSYNKDMTWKSHSEANPNTLLEKMHLALLKVGPQFRFFNPAEQQTVIGYMQIVQNCLRNHLEVCRINSLIRQYRPYEKRGGKK